MDGAGTCNPVPDLLLRTLSAGNAEKQLETYYRHTHTNKFVLLYVQKKNTKLKAIYQSELRKGITHDYSVSLERVLLHFRKKRLITFHFLSQKHINFNKRFFF